MGNSGSATKWQGSPESVACGGGGGSGSFGETRPPCTSFSALYPPIKPCNVARNIKSIYINSKLFLTA